MFPGASSELEAAARAAAPEVFRGDDWWLPVYCYLVETEGTTILVDTGLGPAPRAFMPDASTALLDRVRPDDVDLVAFTHLHVDHIGWNGAFPRARYVVEEAEWSFQLGREQRRALNEEKLLPIEDRVELVSGEYELAPGVRLLPTPGHTPGHASVLVETEGGPLVILGDVCVHPTQLLDPYVLFEPDDDAEAAARTRVETLGRLADDGTAVSVSHFPAAIGRVERDGDAFRWRA